MLIHITEFTKHRLWDDVYATTFDPEIQSYMGVDRARWENPISKNQFIANIDQLYRAGNLEQWAVMKNGEYKGYVALLKAGADREWELGTVINDPELWDTGIGVRATLHVLRHAFNEMNLPWVTCFTQGLNTNVRSILIRGGFKPFMNMLIMSKDDYLNRWGGVS